VTPEDFPHDGHGVQVADAFEIEAIFTDLSDRQLGRMVSCLAPSLGPTSPDFDSEQDSGRGTGRSSPGSVVTTTMTRLSPTPALP
jgi:hypothetical protein